MNQAPVAANLDGVLPFGPAQVVDHVVNGHANDGVAGFSGRGIEEPEINIVARTDAGVAESLTDISVTDVVDHVGGDGPGIAEGHAFAVVDEYRGWALTGELLNTASGVLLEVAPTEDVMLGRRDVIKTDDRGVEGLGVGR